MKCRLNTNFKSSLSSDCSTLMGATGLKDFRGGQKTLSLKCTIDYSVSGVPTLFVMRMCPFGFVIDSWLTGFSDVRWFGNRCFVMCDIVCTVVQDIRVHVFVACFRHASYCFFPQSFGLGEMHVVIRYCRFEYCNSLFIILGYFWFIIFARLLLFTL